MYSLPANETDMLEKLLVIDCPANSDPQNAAQHILRCIPVDGSCEDGDDMAVQCGMVRGDLCVKLWGAESFCCFFSFSLHMHKSNNN